MNTFFSHQSLAKLLLSAALKKIHNSVSDFSKSRYIPRYLKTKRSVLFAHIAIDIMNASPALRVFNSANLEYLHQTLFLSF